MNERSSAKTQTFERAVAITALAGLAVAGFFLWRRNGGGRPVSVEKMLDACEEAVQKLDERLAVIQLAS